MRILPSKSVVFVVVPVILLVAGLVWGLTGTSGSRQLRTPQSQVRAA